MMHECSAIVTYFGSNKVNFTIFSLSSCLYMTFLFCSNLQQRRLVFERTRLCLLDLVGVEIQPKRKSTCSNQSLGDPNEWK